MSVLQDWQRARQIPNMFKLSVIIASTRPGRKGPAVGNWIYQLAKEDPAFESTLLDLAEINLPFLDEPHHPAMRQYQQAHTKKWSATIDAADAFIFVTPEYNFGFPAPLKNALDFLYHEWVMKPVAFVSYGGIAGGTRSVQMLKQVVTALEMMPMKESVNIPFFTKHINEDENFIPGETINKSAGAMLAQLLKWTEALKEMRGK